MFHSRRAWEWTVDRADRAATWLDVGAGSGHYTIRMSKVAQHVAAFEPHNALVAELEILLRRVPNASIVEGVLASETGMYELWTEDREEDGQAHTLNEGRARLGGLGHRLDRHRTVQGFSLDDWRGFSGTERVGLIKIDAPGSELNVLEGARETILADQPLISLRLYPPTDGSKILALLDELGYNISCDGVNLADTVTVNETDQGWVAWPRVKE